MFQKRCKKKAYDIVTKETDALFDGKVYKQLISQYEDSKLDNNRKQWINDILNVFQCWLVDDYATFDYLSRWCGVCGDNDGFEMLNTAKRMPKEINTFISKFKEIEKQVYIQTSKKGDGKDKAPIFFKGQTKRQKVRDICWSIFYKQHIRAH